jgi:hypothetical protein
MKSWWLALPAPSAGAPNNIAEAKAKMTGRVIQHLPEGTGQS